MTPLRTLLLAALVVAGGNATGGATDEPPLPEGARLRLGPTKFRISHNGRMLALTPDGQAIITFRHPDSLVLVSIATGQDVKTVKLPSDNQRGGWYSLERTADGKRLIATQYNAVFILDADTGRVVYQIDVKENDKRLGGLGGSLEGLVAASADGSRIAIGTRYPRNNEGVSAVVLDSATGEIVTTVQPGQSNTIRPVLSADGQLLATFGQYYQQQPNDEAWGAIVQVWDAATGAEKVRVKTGVPHQVQAAIFSPDGTTLVTAAPHGPVQAWNVETGQLIRQYVGRSGIGQRLFFSPDGQRLAAAGTDGTVQVWDTATGRRLGIGGAMVHNVFDVAFPPDGPAVVLGTYSQSLQVWTVPGQILTPQNGHLGPVVAMQFRPDGQHLVTAGQDHRIICWDAATGAELRHLAKPSVDGRSPRSWYFYQAALTPDAKTAIVPHNTSGIVVVDLETGEEDFTLPFSGGRSSSDVKVALSADGRVIAGSCRFYDRGKNGIVACAWDRETGQPLVESRVEHTPNAAGIGGWIQNVAVAVASDGSRMATAYLRQNQHGQPSLELTAYDLSTGQPTAKATYPTQGYTNSLTAAGDRRSVLVPGFDGKIGVWDLPTGTMTRTLDVPSANGQSQVLGFSSDGRLAAVAVSGGPSRPTIRLPGLRPAAQQPGFRLVVLEWATGTPRFEWSTVGLVPAAAFSPDGQTLAAAWPDATVLFFDVTGAGQPSPWTESPSDSAKLWETLATGDGEAGWAAMRELIARPDVAVPLIKQQVKPTAAKPRPTADELAKLIAALDAPAFADREAAGKSLRELGPVAQPAVRQALRETTSPEVRQRLEKLAETLNRPAGINVAAVRAVEVLERIGTGSAKEYLHALADGEPTASLTQDAAAAVQRLRAK
jgi:WD40 repeat protein